jgi:hypothetical protein
MGEACSHDSTAVAEIELHGTVFPSSLVPPRSSKTLFLGGAGFTISLAHTQIDAHRSSAARLYHAYCV